MTTLISWITYDQRGPASLYIASDSRFSWGNSTYWDSGRKIYFSNKYPDIFGFCGDVMFCSQIMSQITSYIDACHVFEHTTSSDSRFDLIYNLVKRSFGDYPLKFSLKNFQILYATREKKRCFHIYLIEWIKNEDINKMWKKRKITLPTKTGIIESLGTGGELYRKHYIDNYKSSEIGEFSRSYYSALSSHIESGLDNLTGGSIQLAGLFNVGSAKAHGVIKNNRRYIYGMEVDAHERINNIRWVNDQFENCDGNNARRFLSAQIQPLPRNINNPLGKGTKKIHLPR
ncbi:Uncharacterised protein [Klebsiella quasipneumoniae]|uniref:hypothetical protein n=1 Tax=Klebsiella quasipneumoniae TaxID=1463165 RepID=UPI001083D31A|nr:hypothetical protein [Klebsiella quasipneumoniae]VGG99223.1 Uncharacterised protein [Klebsiella quasipneumoniae]VGH19059.1 Uncharacterised protein [Klebsiella quasipneumoniae]